MYFLRALLGYLLIAFLVHDRKLQKSHNRLLEYLSDTIQCLKGKRIPFITDKEPALTKAVERFFPTMQVLHYGDHLRLRADLSKMEFTCLTGDRLPSAKMRTNLKKVYENLTATWAEKAKEYFDWHMKRDLLSCSGRWIIQGSQTTHPRA